MEDVGNIKWQRDGQTACPNCSSANIILIEYGYPSPESYDGISEYKCIDCGYREGRWTGKELKTGYIEPRYGRGGEPIPISERRSRNVR